MVITNNKKKKKTHIVNKQKKKETMEVAKLPEFNSDDGNFNNPMFWFLFGDASVGADRGSNSKKNLKILQSWLRSEVKPNETRLVHGAIRTLDRMNEIFSARMNVEVVVDAQRKKWYQNSQDKFGGR